jgi:hypothetical protein
MTVGCEYTRISLLFQCLSSVNFTLLLRKPEMFYNSISLTIKSKTYPRHLGGFMGIFNPQIISRTQPLVIVSDLAKFKPLPLSGIKTAQTMGIEPITADNLSSILSQRSHQIAASI